MSGCFFLKHGVYIVSVSICCTHQDCTVSEIYLKGTVQRIEWGGWTLQPRATVSSVPRSCKVVTKCGSVVKTCYAVMLSVIVSIGNLCSRLPGTLQIDWCKTIYLGWDMHNRPVSGWWTLFLHGVCTLRFMNEK